MNIYELADLIIEWWETFDEEDFHNNGDSFIDEPKFVKAAYKIQEERV